ncbi:MAG: helix-turn-helix domain-containing protein [Methanobrevibacter sp.]|nr:helix-turn-helix domain-containing protein [Methanobrevibacter sp.]
MNNNDNKKQSFTQCNMIAEYLENGYSITALEALQMFGCMRLASRICDLRDRGYNIATCKIKTETGKYVTEYTLKR